MNQSHKMRRTRLPNRNNCTSVRHGGLGHLDGGLILIPLAPQLSGQVEPKKDSTISQYRGLKFFCSSIKTSFPSAQSIFCPNLQLPGKLYSQGIVAFHWAQTSGQGDKRPCPLRHHRNYSNLPAISSCCLRLWFQLRQEPDREFKRKS